MGGFDGQCTRIRSSMITSADHVALVKAKRMRIEMTISGHFILTPFPFSFAHTGPYL